MAVPDFQGFQRQFLAHLRDPAGHPAPQGAPSNRLKLYQKLLYNKIEDSLLACFPITHELLGKRRWSGLVKAFIAGHRCLSPYYRRIPDEFIAYLQEERDPANDPPYLAELAHYEWIELVLAIALEEPDFRAINRQGDLLQGQPAFAPAMRLLSYRYPVHRIIPGNRRNGYGETEKPCFLLGFRTPEDEVRFIEVNAATARLIELLQAGGVTGQEALSALAEELKHPDAESLMAFGADILESLREQSAILGVRPPRPFPINTRACNEKIR